MENTENFLMGEHDRRAASPNRVPGILPDLPLYETDLVIPKYRDGKWGDWEIRTANLILDHGYHTGIWLVQGLQVLTKQGKDEDTLPATWMSPCPHEIESQELGCRHAFGHTVIMGLGLGWCVVNAAMNPSVEKVTVLELDPMVIRLFDEIKVLDQAPERARKKIRILEADAMEWQPDEPVDFLYADIWQSLAEAETLTQVRQMQANIDAEQIYFWGQELFIYTRAKRQWGEILEMDNDLVKKCIDQVIGLPLLIPPDTDYGAMIQRIIRNRLARGLPLQR